MLLMESVVSIYFSCSAVSNSVNVSLQQSVQENIVLPLRCEQTLKVIVNKSQQMAKCGN